MAAIQLQRMISSGVSADLRERLAIGGARISILFLRTERHRAVRNRRLMDRRRRHKTSTLHECFIEQNTAMPETQAGSDNLLVVGMPNHPCQASSCTGGTPCPQPRRALQRRH